jgi:hypothetical protein
LSIIATALKHLIAAGVSGEDLVRAVAEMEAALVPAQPVRTKGALRTERYRERQRHKASQSVTCDESDACDAVPPNEYISNPPPKPQIAKAISSPLAETAERVVEAWNRDTAGTPLPQTRGLNPDRRKHLAARIKEHGEDAVYLAIRGMAGSPWHSGKSGDWTNGNLGWLLKSPENFQKMLDLAPAAKAAAPAKTPEEWREYCLSTAEHFEGRGNMHDAEEWRRKAGVRPDRPPGFARPIGDLIPAMARG